MQFIFNYKIYHYCVWVKLTEGPVLGGACTCSSTHNTLQILLRTIGTQHWSYLLLAVQLTEGPVLGGAEPNPVLSKICSVLLCVLEHVQPRVDNSSAGSQLFSCH
jgi:hypothetical protein